MATGLKKGNSYAQFGNMSIQALESEEIDAAASGEGVVAVGNNAYVTQFGTPYAGSQASPQQNGYNSNYAVIPPIQVPGPSEDYGVNNYQTQPILDNLVVPIKLKGISEQRPEILSLTNFEPYYANKKGPDKTNVGDFIEVSFAAQRMRFKSIQNLYNSLYEVEDAKKDLIRLGNQYLRDISDTRDVVSFMGKINRQIERIRQSFYIKNGDSFFDENDSANNKITAKSYKDFLVDEYHFSESGFLNFSNTKILGQFLYDATNTLRQYSPTLFGSNNVVSPSVNNYGASNDFAQPSVENPFALEGYSSEPSNQTVERSADRNYGKYNNKNIDITDGQFSFRMKLLNDIDFPIVGTTYYQFLDLLPASADDKMKLLSVLLSKEMRVSSGLGTESIADRLRLLGGDSVGDPFRYIIGEIGETISDPIIGESSLMSLLSYKQGGKTILPFEDRYVEDSNGTIYIPGKKYLADSILQGSTPFSIVNLQQYQTKIDETYPNALSLIRQLLDYGQNRVKLKPIDLFNDMAEDMLSSLKEMENSLTSENISLSPIWGEVSIIKNAISDSSLRHLLFQYVLILGMIGKTSGDIENANISDFYKEMSKREITKWGDLPAIQTNSDLGQASTSDTTAGIGALEIVAQKIINKISSIPSTSASNGVVPTSYLLDLLKSANGLIILGKMSDFVSTLIKRGKGIKEIFDEGLERTRFNRLNHTTLSVMSFEMYVAFIEYYYNFISEASTDSNGATVFSYDRSLLKNNIFILKYATAPVQTIQNTITQFLTVLPQFNFLVPLLSTFLGQKVKLQTEESIIGQIIKRLDKTFKRISSITSESVDFFNPSGPNSQLFNTIIEGVDGSDKVASLSKAQFILAQKALYDFEQNKSLSFLKKDEVNKNEVRRQSRRVRNIKKFPVFVDDSLMTPVEKRLVKALFNDSKYRKPKSDNLKIISVGIPSGFLDNIQSSIKTNEKRSNFIRNKEKDIISINVYRKSLDFEDIVFKPKSYLFEISRFIDKSKMKRFFDNNKIGPSLNVFDILSEKNVVEMTKDFDDFGKRKRETFDSFLQDSDYSFLSEEDKKNMVFNHVESHVLGLYLELLTGVSSNESDYLINKDMLEGRVDDDVKQRFKSLITLYVSGLSGQALTIEQIKESSPQLEELLNKIDDFRLDNNFVEQIKPLSLPGVSRSASIELTEDLINFLKLYTPKSLLTGGKSYGQRIVSPKMFERIFNLAIDPDDFEIDLNLTLETNAGTNMYKSLSKRGLLKTPTKLVERSSATNIHFEQFFVTVSTVGATEV